MKRREFERTTPEAVGLRSEDIEWLLDELESGFTEMHGLMIMRHGKVCAEGWWAPYGPGVRHGLQSLSKTYAATAVGIACTEGLLHLDDKVIDIFPDEAPEKPSENLKKMTVRDVLCMGCGMDTMSPADEHWIRSFLATPVLHEPGTTYMYNSMGSTLLGAMVRKVTGLGLQDYLTPRLFDKIGIDAANLRWMTMPDGMEVGGGGLFATTEDNLRLMKLYTAQAVVSPRELREVYAKPFQAAITDGKLDSVMNSYAAIDGQVPAGSKAILRDLLRSEMGFNGVTVSDYSAVEQLESIYHLAESPADAGRLALEAGMDQELPTIAAYNDELKENIRSGVVQESLLDEAVLRILTMKFRLGLFENPFPAENVQAEITPADTALNRKIAQESMILLKNDGVLPLAKSVKKVAVIGWHADSVRALFGGYSALAMKENTLGVKMSMAGIQADADSPAAENAVQKTYPGSEVVMENPGVEPLARRCYPDAYSMLGALRLAAPHTEFLYAQGYPYAGNEESGHDAALQIAKDADLVICTLGGHYGWNASCTTGEGIDAMHIGLPVCQERFLEKLESLHKPVVGVHFDGHPISSDTADRVCNAILEAWAPGAQGGEAIAALLTGTANPCGKLPCTVARHEGQIPVYYNHPTNTCYSMTGGTPKNAYIDGAHTPRYCFGHGLSYTKYEYDTLRLEKDAIQADGVLKGQLHVRNAGNKAGTEIVQFYVHDVAASMVRPVKELVGFAKVNLQPGEEKTVCLSLPMSQLAFLDADMRWKVEHGKVELMVGASSEDIRGKAEFMIVGDAYPDGKNRSFVADTKIM